MISTGIPYSCLPESYIRPESERPRLTEVSTCKHFPIIDLGSDDRFTVVEKIGHACKSFGFFYVINHGVKEETIEKMLSVSKEFFNLSVEEKMKLYSNDPTKTTRLLTSANLDKEKVHNWRDMLRLQCHPLQKYVPEWPSNPPPFKEFASAYCSEVRQLGLRLQELIAESLGLQTECITKILGEQGQIMAVNFYPPCPEPELTYGLPKHTDPHALTILLQDSAVAGLQVSLDGKWVGLAPIPNAFVINIGDQMQMLSNGIYKSVWHRAVVNADKSRMSIVSFLCPSDYVMLRSPKALIDKEGQSMYRDYTYAEYNEKYWSRNIDQEQCLELFKN